MRKLILLLLPIMIMSCDKDEEILKTPREEQRNRNIELSTYNMTILFQQSHRDKVFYINHSYNKDYDIHDGAEELYLFRLWNDKNKPKSITINVADLIDNYNHSAIHLKPTFSIFDELNFRQFTISTYTAIDSFVYSDGLVVYTQLRYERTDTISPQNNLFIVQDY